MKIWFNATRGLFVTWLVGILIVFVACDAVAEDAKFSPEKRAQIEAAVSKFMAAKHIPGVSLP